MDGSNPILAPLNTSGVAPSPQPTRSLTSYAPGPLATARQRLEPASTETIIRALSGCLTLTAPSGFSEGDRKAWLTAAAATLAGIPPQLLEWGVSRARKVADHPAKIVPAIMEEIGEAWERRREDLRREADSGHRLAAPKEPADPPCTPEQAAAILAEFPQLSAGMRQTLTQHLGPRRNPTRQDYIDLGVDPSDLPTITNTEEGKG